MAAILKTFIVGPELEQVDTEDHIDYIKGQYIINREKVDYRDYDTDKDTLNRRKQDKVEYFREKYNINEQKLDRKVALWVVLPFCIVSFIHYMTRFSIAVASQVGMQESLHLSDNQYNIASSVFFVPYVIFELVSNIILKYVRPHYFMSFYILMLGVTILANGFVSNFGGLLVCRMFTGLFQSNSSALYYILANYYPAFKAQKAFTAYYSFGTLGGLLSFLLTKAVIKINVLEHWRWIFIIEGIITVFFAFVLFFFIPDFPEGARFLDDEETIFLVKKLEVYSGRSGYQLNISFKDICGVLKDSLLWCGTLAYLGVLACSYGYAFFEPTIVKDLAAEMTNKTGNETHLLLFEAIPFIISFFMANLFAFLSDYIQLRSPFAIIGILIALIGLVLIDRNPNNKSLRYYGCCFSIIGLSCTVPIIVCWITLNFGGHLRKNVSTAWLVSFASTSGIFSTYLFQPSDAPIYTTGIWSNVIFLSFSLFCIVIYLLILYRENKLKTYSSYREEFEQLSARDKTFLGDKSPSFKYMF